MGSFAFSSRDLVLLAIEGSIQPSLTDMSAAMTVPAETASPCNQTPACNRPGWLNAAQPPLLLLQKQEAQKTEGVNFTVKHSQRTCSSNAWLKTNLDSILSVPTNSLSHFGSASQVTLMSCGHDKKCIDSVHASR